MNIVNSTPLG